MLWVLQDFLTPVAKSDVKLAGVHDLLQDCPNPNVWSVRLNCLDLSSKCVWNVGAQSQNISRYCSHLGKHRRAFLRDGGIIRGDIKVGVVR